MEIDWKRHQVLQGGCIHTRRPIRTLPKVYKIEQMADSKSHCMKHVKSSCSRKTEHGKGTTLKSSHEKKRFTGGGGIGDSAPHITSSLHQ